MWVRLKGERVRVDMESYVVKEESYSGALVGRSYAGKALILDTGALAEMNARFDDMAAYQDKAAHYRSGAMWCYDMNWKVGEKAVTDSERGANQP